MTAVSATVAVPDTATKDRSFDSASTHSLSSLLNFLDPAPSPSENSPARAPKRRKLAGGKSLAVQPVEAFDDTASALLKTVKLDFVSCGPAERREAS